MKRLIAFAAIATLALPQSVRAQDEGAQLQALLSKQAASIVTVKTVLRMEAKGGGDSDASESRLTLQGVVVDPNGLVMMSNTPFSPMRLMEAFGGGGGDAESNAPKMRPTSLKVSLQGEEPEYDAFMAATDSKLELAFIQIEGLNGRKLQAVDFATSVDPTVGQKVASVLRMSKGYDYAPFFRTARVCGVVSKPRRAWVLEGGGGEVGMPVYAESGEPVGVLTMLSSGVKEGRDDSRSFGMAMRMIMGGGAMEGVFLVPGAVVKAVIDQAAKRGAELAVQRATQKAAGPTVPPSKPAPTKPAPAKPPARK